MIGESHTCWNKNTSYYNASVVILAHDQYLDCWTRIYRKTTSCIFLCKFETIFYDYYQKADRKY